MDGWLLESQIYSQNSCTDSFLIYVLLNLLELFCSY